MANNKYLYSCFDHWFHNGGTVFFYSDPHFDDGEMTYLRKNYIGDDEQVKSINSKIGKNDTLVILGDIGNVEFVKKLKGYKVLISGNHDNGASNYLRSRIVWLGQQAYDALDEEMKKQVVECNNGFMRSWVYDDHLFDEVYTGTLQISPKIILSHEPVDYRYCFNIHGHDHSRWHPADDAHLNVCAELIDYTPVALNSIVKSGVLKKIPDIHREAIDGAIGDKKTLDN